MPDNKMVKQSEIDLDSIRTDLPSNTKANANANTKANTKANANANATANANANATANANANATANANANANTTANATANTTANATANTNNYTWNDVFRMNNEDPDKVAEWLNNNSGYQAGNLTKKNMQGFGYQQNSTGKWEKSNANAKSQKEPGIQAHINSNFTTKEQKAALEKVGIDTTGMTTGAITKTIASTLYNLLAFSARTYGVANLDYLENPLWSQLGKDFNTFLESRRYNMERAMKAEGDVTYEEQLRALNREMDALDQASESKANVEAEIAKYETYAKNSTKIQETFEKLKGSGTLEDLTYLMRYDPDIRKEIQQAVGTGPAGQVINTVLTYLNDPAMKPYIDKALQNPIVAGFFKLLGIDINSAQREKERGENAFNNVQGNLIQQKPTDRALAKSKNHNQQLAEARTDTAKQIQLQTMLNGNGAPSEQNMA